VGRSQSRQPMPHRRLQLATLYVRSVRLVMDAVAKAGQDTAPRMGIALASGSSTRSAEIPRAAASLKMPPRQAKTVRVRWRRADLQKGNRTRSATNIVLAPRFALAIGAFPMLETARIGGNAGPHRSVAQLVEHRSPKPGVAGSSPATPAREVSDFDRSDSNALEQIGSPLVPACLDLWPWPQYIPGTCCRPVIADIRRGFKTP
jgi:hypothetical protein